MLSLLLIVYLVHQIFAVRDNSIVVNQNSVTDDVIELNIGGEKITTLRSTLTAIPNSKLALMFSQNNTKNLLFRDKDGAVFFDYNPIYFNYLLDQLRIIKRMPNKFGYQLQFAPPPYSNPPVNFTQMLVDLGLTQEYFLSPIEGTHVNLSINSLAGWQECYRSTYDHPFDLSVLTKSCNGSRLLVACRPVGNKKLLTLAGIGQREDILHPCLPRPRKNSNKKNRALTYLTRYQCMTQAKRGVGWYSVNNRTLGFVRGSLSFVINPCDSSNLDSDYRLCWTTVYSTNQDINHGDRCGSAKNIHKSNKWERLIYYIQ